MTAWGCAWVERLPAELAGQRAILRRLLAACESTETIRWLVIACSVGRGAGDWLSDLDLGMGVSDDVFDVALSDVRQVVDDLADLVDSYQHQLPGLTIRHERIFAQYTDRCQVDLVVVPALQTLGPVRDEVVLYDPDNHVTGSYRQQAVTPQQIREWAFGGWCALADLGKYLRRGSSWEALQRLNEGREQLWRLWAAVLDVPNPAYGLTSILDFAPDRVPAGVGATVSDLDPGRLLAAARSMAGQLSALGDRLPREHQAALPDAMSRFVTSDLAEMAGPD